MQHWSQVGYEPTMLRVHGKLSHLWIFVLLPGSQVGVGALVQNTAEVVFRQCLLRHLLQLLLLLQGQTVVLQLNALWGPPQPLGQARLLQPVDLWDWWVMGRGWRGFKRPGQGGR